MNIARPERLPGVRMGLEWLRNTMLDRVGDFEGGRLCINDPFGSRVLGDAGPLHGMDVHNPWFYPRLLSSGSVGLGETYADGWWDSDNLFACLRLLARNRDRWMGLSSNNPLGLFHQFFHWANENTVNGSRKNIRDHYDLGNKFYELILDKTRTYSCGIHNGQSDQLVTAQIEKLDRICEKLDLDKGCQVLEIGTGWGSFAVHAAVNYGCTVTTTTISEDQYEYTKDLVRRRGLDHKINVLKKDYRELTGQFDRIVSIEMIEAVGEQYLTTFFDRLDEMLNPGGEVLLQGIHMMDQYYETYRSTVDFIQRYIFPGGHLPSLGRIKRELARTNLSVSGFEEMGQHYVKTLEHWKQSLLEHQNRIRNMGFDRYFIRLWKYYLSYCQAGFETEQIGVFQMKLSNDRYSRNGLEP